MPYSVYFNIPMIIMYLRVIETLICHTEIIEVNRVYFLRFCTKTLHAFQNTVLNLLVALSAANTKKHDEYMNDRFRSK